jgi:hypothetical protein
VSRSKKHATPILPNQNAKKKQKTEDTCSSDSPLSASSSQYSSSKMDVPWRAVSTVKCDVRRKISSSCSCVNWEEDSVSNDPAPNAA